MRDLNILLLAALGAAGQQKNDFVTVASEIDSIPRSEIHSALQDTAADALNVRKVALRKACESDRYPGGTLRVETFEPIRKRAAAC